MEIEFTPVRRVIFVEFETDQPDPPVSWFVFATPEQEAVIQKLMDDHVEDWQNGYVGEVKAQEFEAFLEDWKEWGITDDD